MTDDLVTPADVEREMVDLTRRIDKAPGVIREYHERVREARKAYKHAYAVEFTRAEGTQLERKLKAELATEKLADALDLAEVEYKHVIDTLDSLRAKLRALQSISSLMKASMFGSHGGS